jgi:hypothetical protein
VEVVGLQRGGYEPLSREGVDDSKGEEPRRDIGTDVVVRFNRSEGGGVRSAQLVSPEASPCSAGIMAEFIFADGKLRRDRPVTLTAAQKMVFGFPREARISSAPLMLDFEVVEPSGSRCLRVPLASPGQAWQAVPPLWTWGLSASVLGLMRLPADALLQIEGLLGHWVGPLRASMRAGIGFSASRTDLGAVGNVTSRQKRADGFVGSLAPEVTYFPVAVDRRALGVSVGYQLAGVAFSGGPVGTPDVAGLAHGPRLSLLMMAISPRPSGAARGTPIVGTGLELSVSRQEWPNATGRSPLWTAAIGVTFVRGGGGRL